MSIAFPNIFQKCVQNISEVHKMEKISKNLNENIRYLKDIFKNDSTFIVRHLETRAGQRCCVFFCDGMVSTPVVNDSVVRPVVSWNEKILPGSEIADLKTKVLFANDIKIAKTFDDAISAILYGDTLLVTEGADMALIINTKGFALRSISEPGGEKIVTGPREGFTEGIMQNTTLIRRRLKSEKLKFSFVSLGTVSKTTCCVCYIDGIADENVVNELKKRLEKVKIDGILNSNYIEENITDRKGSPIELIGKTERPDVVASRLLEGRVALIVDGTPVALTMPYIFIEQFQSAEDYYANPFFSSFSRLVRIMGFFVAISALPVYISLITYHPEMLPSPLLFSISAARDNVPLPTVLEAFALLISFDILREAGKRTPDVIGQTMSIVGALILGQAAVEARFVSAPMIIVVAISGITGLMLPNMRSLITFSRLMLMALSSFMGLYGYIFGLLWMMSYIVSTSSFGVPVIGGKLWGEDSFIRVSWSRMKPWGRFIGGNDED